MNKKISWLVACALLALTGDAWALYTAYFNADRDTSIGSESTGSGNGGGAFIYAGYTGTAQRRALLRFNVESSGNCSGDCSIPSNAVVVDARVRLYLSRVAAPTAPLVVDPSVDLRFYRLTQSWTEGTENPADGSEGGLLPVTSGGATWLNRFSTTAWSTAGGTTSGSGSTMTVNTTLGYKYLTGTASDPLAAHVQGWIDQTYVNHGWVIRAVNSTTPYSARQFTSRQGVTGPPELRVRWARPQGASGCTVDSDCAGSLSCTNGVCCTSSSCPAPNGCYLSGSCQAGTGVCVNPYNNGASCASDGQDCTRDVCSNGSCTHPADMGGTTCRSAPSECDEAESCQNGNPVCPADGVKSAGTACSSDALACTLDECNGSSKLCQHPVAPGGDTVLCRSASPANPCDKPDYCDGVSSTCPTDEKYGPETQCSGPSCDTVPEPDIGTLPAFCDGVSDSCPAAETQECLNGCLGDVCVGACTVATQTSDCPLNWYCNEATGVCEQRKALGSTCATNNSCNSRFCIDGVCCNSVCGGGDDGDCQACDVSGSEGTCTVSSPGTVCRGSGGVCDVIEQCDGGLTCGNNVYKSASEECVPQSCTGGVMTAQTFCPGDGPTCPSPDQIPCAPYVCSGTACGSTCASDFDCSVGNYCDLATSQCLDKQPDGVLCDEDKQCESDVCVDGVCCDRACLGQCEACDLDGSQGTCGTVAAGPPHGDRTPCASDGSICGGACDGSFTDKCNYPAAATVCRPGECTSGVATVEAVCDGAGACPALETLDCDPFACGPVVCVGTCVSDTQCAAGHYCVAGLCEPQSADGTACTTGSECLSGYCIDGVCCDTACGGQCEACAETGSVGTCKAVTGEPRAPRAACLSDDSICGGTCNGVERKSCTYPTFGTVCRTGQCVTDQAVLQAQCNGSGACPPEVRQDCGGAGCDGSLCAGGCVIDTDCGLGQYCSAGVCVGLLPLGADCGDNNDACSSGSCVDGVCCSSLCAGQCEACDVAGSVGTCTAVSGEPPRGTRPPCTSDGSACGGICMGDPDGCAYPGEETSCRAASCDSGLAVLAANCDGSGRCEGPLEQTCPGACAGDVCGGGCTQDTDCASGQWCSGGVCTDLLEQGDVCTGDAQCATGHCADGRCCGSACDDQCKSCNQPGSLGLCTPVFGAPQGGRPQCGGTGPCAGVCDGFACTFPINSVTCGDGVCVDGVSIGVSTCSGNGACLRGVQTVCNPAVCDGTLCASECFDDSECLPGTVCDNFQCVPFVATPDAGAGGATGVDAGVGGFGGFGAFGGNAGSAGVSGAGGSAPGPTTGGSGAAAGSGGGSSAGTGPSLDGGVPLDGGSDGSAAADPGGCGCRVGRDGPHGRGLAWAALAMLALSAARRRHRV